MLLRPAGSSVITIVRARGTLASNAIITREARAGASLAIAGALVGALHPRVNIVGIDHLTDPSKVTRASTLGAIRSCPLILSIKSLEALAIVVNLASSMAGAVILTETSRAVPLLVPYGLIPYSFSIVRRGRRRGRRSLHRRHKGNKRQSGQNHDFSHEQHNYNFWVIPALN